MKNLILICVVLFLCGCVKIQKKSEVESVPDQVVQPLVEKFSEPVIFVLDEVLSQTQDILIIADEVHLKTNARIYTNQFSLRIEATRIYIDRGAFIQTFAEDQTIAPIEQNAIDGGVVHIKGNDIYGNLRIFMNGQSGGVGLGGWSGLPASPNPYVSLPPQEPCLPNSGRNSGASGSFFLEVNQSQDFSISTSMKVAEGGSIGPVSADYFWTVKDYKTKYKKAFDWQSCNTIPVTGKAGMPGQICLKLSATDLARCERY